MIGNTLGKLRGKGVLWGDRWDSNPRQPESQSGTLPTELRPPLKLVRHYTKKGAASQQSMAHVRRAHDLNQGVKPQQLGKSQRQRAATPSGVGHQPVYRWYLAQQATLLEQAL
jgi:hypothetical protein